jgi:hypothetical protein
VGRESDKPCVALLALKKIQRSFSFSIPVYLPRENHYSVWPGGSPSDWHGSAQLSVLYMAMMQVSVMSGEGRILVRHDSGGEWPVAASK